MSRSASVPRFALAIFAPVLFLSSLSFVAGFGISSHNQGIGSAVTLDTVGVSSAEPSAPF